MEALALVVPMLMPPMLVALVVAQATVALNLLVQAMTTQTVMPQEMTALPLLKTPVMVQW